MALSTFIFGTDLIDAPLYVSLEVSLEVLLVEAPMSPKELLKLREELFNRIQVGGV